VPGIERAGREAVQEGGQKVSYANTRVDTDRPATVTTSVRSSGDRERAGVAFGRWNEALAQRARILRKYLHGEDIHREWIEEGFQKELDIGLWSDEEAARPLIDASRGASAERRVVRRLWLDLWRADRRPGRLVVNSGPVLGALVGLAIAEYGARAGKSKPSTRVDNTDR